MGWDDRFIVLGEGLNVGAFWRVCPWDGMVDLGMYILWVVNVVDGAAGRIRTCMMRIEGVLCRLNYSRVLW